MLVVLAVTVWMASSVSSSSYTESTLPNITTEEFIKECVHIHNRLRSKVYPKARNMLYMCFTATETEDTILDLVSMIDNGSILDSCHHTSFATFSPSQKGLGPCLRVSWDPKLAQIAKAWTQTCQFQHNPQLGSGLHPNFTVLGENLWTGSLSLFSPYSAIKSWYDEIKYYEFNTMRCTHVCGHYTQVVWADSYKIGCAVQFCPKVSGFNYPNAAHFICNYGPAGNYPTHPYQQGTTCSKCPKDDKCLNNLCINQQRDQVSRYYSVDDPDRPINPRNRYTSLFLIAKSVLLLLSVLITIWVKHKYPNLILLD